MLKNGKKLCRGGRKTSRFMVKKILVAVKKIRCGGQKISGCGRKISLGMVDELFAPIESFFVAVDKLVAAWWKNWFRWSKN